MQTPETVFIETEFGKIALWNRGAGSVDSPAILFLHGNSASKEVFSRQFDATSFSSYRLIAIDFPGQGESGNSSSPDRDYNICGFARTATKVMQHLGLEDYLIYGWSLGGHVALEMAAQGAPIRGIAMSGTPPIGPGGEAMAEVFSTQPHVAMIGQAELNDQEIDTYLQHALGDGELVPQLIKDKVKRTDTAMRPTLINHWAISDEGTDQPSLVADWENLIAVFQGKQECFFDNSYLNQLKWRNLWQNKIHLIPNAGHAPFLQNTQTFNEHLLHFAQDCFGD